MKQITWGWKVKYMILFLWIFLFSCKAHQAQQPTVQQTEKEIVAASAHLWQWVKTHVDHAQ
jgi:hypothetical protein